MRIFCSSCELKTNYLNKPLKHGLAETQLMFGNIGNTALGHYVYSRSLKTINDILLDNLLRAEKIPFQHNFHEQ